MAARFAGPGRACRADSRLVPVASPPPLAVTGDHAHPAEHLPEPAARPESVIAQAQVRNVRGGDGGRPDQETSTEAAGIQRSDGEPIQFPILHVPNLVMETTIIGFLPR